MYFIFSNNTQRILAMGLGTCQEKKKKKKILSQKIVSGCQQFQTPAPVSTEPHSVARETLKSKVPKATVNVALNNK